VLLLVLGSALFVAAEYSLITARRARLEERGARGSRGARRALRLMDEPVRFIGVIQLGITVFAILIGAVGEPLLSDFFEPPQATMSNTARMQAVLARVCRAEARRRSRIRMRRID